MKHSIATSSRQGGVALIVVLCLLLLMALLAIAGMSEQRAQAQAAFVAADHARALQAADSALAAAERWLSLATIKPEAMVGCNSPCGATNLVWAGSPPQIENWSTFDWNDDARIFGVDYPIPGGADDATVTANPALAHVSHPPAYVIEELGSDPDSEDAAAPGGYSGWYYRITACAYGSTGNLRVMTQSIYLKRFETPDHPSTSTRNGRLTWHELGDST